MDRETEGRKARWMKRRTEGHSNKSIEKGIKEQQKTWMDIWKDGWKGGWVSRRMKIEKK